jgi:glycosyltransferase involved in cell wall biosynthesis
MPTRPGRLVLAAYTHFGARGLKGTEMYYFVREAWKKGDLRQVIAISKSRCQYEFDSQLVETLPGESCLISALGKLQEKMWRGFPARWLGEKIFDRYAASRLSGPGGLLIATPRLIKTAHKAKTLGYKTCLYGSLCDPRYFLQQLHIEQQALGLKGAKHEKGRSLGLARFAAHVESSDYIITISDFAKETYVAQGFPSERIFVAPLGVDLRRFPPTPVPADGRFTYLFVAHLTGTTGILKGLPYLLQAWSELNLENAQLLVCGKISQELQELIQRYVTKLRNVEFTGPVNNPETYYQKASVFIFPTIAEGFGKVVLEAMASGRPVIATSVPSPVIREGIDGFYIPSREAKALKDKMLYFYNNREEITKMGTTASEQARRFTWERFSKQIADIVAEVAAT